MMHVDVCVYVCVSVCLGVCGWQTGRVKATVIHQQNVFHSALLRFRIAHVSYSCCLILIQSGQVKLKVKCAILLIAVSK